MARSPGSFTSASTAEISLTSISRRMFRAELFDPDHWAEFFARSGARYVALTSKHHEGFTLWRSAEANRDWGRPWNTVDIGPKRDMLLDLMEAAAAKACTWASTIRSTNGTTRSGFPTSKRYVAEHMFRSSKTW